MVVISCHNTHAAAAKQSNVQWYHFCAIWPCGPTLNPTTSNHVSCGPFIWVSTTHWVYSLHGHGDGQQRVALCSCAQVDESSRSTCTHVSVWAHLYKQYKSGEICEFEYAKMNDCRWVFERRLCTSTQTAFLPHSRPSNPFDNHRLLPHPRRQTTLLPAQTVYKKVLTVWVASPPKVLFRICVPRLHLLFPLCSHALRPC